VGADEVVPEEEGMHECHMRFDPLAVRIRQPRIAPHRHSHREIAPFDMASPEPSDIRIPANDPLRNRFDSGRGVFVSRIVRFGWFASLEIFDELAEIDILAEGFLDRINIGRKSIGVDLGRIDQPTGEVCHEFMSRCLSPIFAVQVGDHQP